MFLINLLAYSQNVLLNGVEIKHQLTSVIRPGLHVLWSRSGNSHQQNYRSIVST